jgi:microcystin-dependent protein
MPRGSGGIYSQPASDVNPPISGTVIDPAAFAALMTDISTEISNSLDRLGRGGMLANLQMGGFKITGAGAATSATDGARLADLSSYLPAGAIMDFAMPAAPLGWLACDGSAVSRTAQAALFAAIGTTWGVGDGSTTFNLPDLRGTVRRSLDAGKGLDPARVFASYQADALASHTHVQNPHNHAITDPGHTHTLNAGQGVVGTAPGPAFSSTAASGPTGSSPTGITINNAVAVNQSTGGPETTVKNYAVLTCVRT